MSLNNSIEKIKSIDGTSHYINAKYWNGHENITADDLGLSSALKYCGVTTTKLIDGDTTNPVVIDGKNHTATTGCVVFYEDKEDDKITSKFFLFDGTKWKMLGEDLTHIVNTEVLNVSNNIQAGSLSKTTYVGNWIFSGPVSTTNGYAYKVDNIEVSEYKKFLDNLIKYPDSQIYADYNIDLRLIGYDITAETVSFNEPIDYEYSSSKGKIAKNISNKFFPVGYFIAKEASSKSYSEKSSVAMNTSEASGLASSSSNQSKSYAPYSFAEGISGATRKAGRFCQCKLADDTTGEVDDGYTGAYGIGSHIEGNLTVSTLSGTYGHAEGHSTVSNSFAAHAEGARTFATGQSSHAEGETTNAFGDYSHSEGIGDVEFYEVDGDFLIDNIIDQWNKNKNINIALGVGSHTEGYNCCAAGNYSHAEGEKTLASGVRSHAEGQGTTASGNRSHAEGYNTMSDGINSHAEGYSTTASGEYSHAEGYSTTASGNKSHAEGNNTTASAANTHAEGSKTQATKQNAHAEGYNTIASGDHSHAEGHTSTASGKCTHCGGNYSTASGDYSFAHGYNVNATNANEVAFGKFNSTSDDTLFSVGCGSSDTKRKNAMEIKNDDGSVSVIFNGAVTATSFDQSSDERLKIFKSDINVDLDKLAELRKSYFTFIEDPGTNRLGVSAQEIQELYPEIVTEGADGFLKVDYSKLSVIALKAIDILHNKNKELEDRLNKIEKMLNL